MTRMLLTFATLAATGGIAANIIATPGAAPVHDVQIVGSERPLFLGSAVVSAIALPEVR